MTRITTMAVALVVGAILWAPARPAAQSSAAVALRAAMETETVRGDLKAAIEQYRALAKNPDRAIAAQALVRMAGCHQKLGDAQAKAIYEQVVRDFGDQTGGGRAGARLSARQQRRPQRARRPRGVDRARGGHVRPRVARRHVHHVRGLGRRRQPDAARPDDGHEPAAHRLRHDQAGTRSLRKAPPCRPTAKRSSTAGSLRNSAGNCVASSSMARVCRIRPSCTRPATTSPSSGRWTGHPTASGLRRW